VNGAGRQLLAGAAFSLKEQGCVSFSQSERPREHVLHRATAGDKLAKYGEVAGELGGKRRRPEGPERELGLAEEETSGETPTCSGYAELQSLAFATEFR